MPNKMLIDATHPEETRVVVVRGNRVRSNTGEGLAGADPAAQPVEGDVLPEHTEGALHEGEHLHADAEHHGEHEAHDHDEHDHDEHGHDDHHHAHDDDHHHDHDGHESRHDHPDHD